MKHIICMVADCTITCKIPIVVFERDNPSAQVIIFEYLIENLVWEPTAKLEVQRSSLSVFATERCTWSREQRSYSVYQNNSVLNWLRFLLSLLANLHHTWFGLHHAQLELHQTSFGLHHTQLGLHHTQVGLHHTQVGQHYTRFGLHHIQVGLHHTPFGLHHTQLKLYHTRFGLHYTQFGLQHVMFFDFCFRMLMGKDATRF